MLLEHGQVLQELLWLRIIKMENKVAIITGGAGGIGSSICSNFVSEGTRVVIADGDYARSKSLADELGDYAIGVEVDVKDEPSGIVYNQFTNGPFTLADIDEDNLNLNVNLYADGTGAIPAHPA